MSDPLRALRQDIRRADRRVKATIQRIKRAVMAVALVVLGIGGFIVFSLTPTCPADRGPCAPTGLRGASFGGLFGAAVAPAPRNAAFEAAMAARGQGAPQPVSADIPARADARPASGSLFFSDHARALR